MSKQPEALRLADMADVTDRSVIWQKWKQDACEQLRTQHALLERARDALNALCDASMCHLTDVTSCTERSVAVWSAASEAADAITAHLEPK